MLLSIANLVDPAIGLPRRPARVTSALHRAEPGVTQLAGEWFTAARTRTTDPLVRLAYRQLEEQTDRQYAALTDPGGAYRLSVVATRQITPYDNAAELIASVLATRTLEVPAPDRPHPLLGNEPGGAYGRLRAVHDLIGHVATGYGFDRHGEYSAWLVQRRRYTGLARWAAATELHAEVSALWVTGQFPEHKAALLDPQFVNAKAPGAAGVSPQMWKLIT